MSEEPLTPAVLRSLQRWAGAAVLVVLLLGLSLGYTLPRSMAYGELLQENLALKAQLVEVDQRLDEVDRLLLRLRLYDAQLEGLASPRGEHGPLPPGTYANASLSDALPLDGMLHAPPPLVGESTVERVDDLILLMASAEPELSEAMVSLEELSALQSALPDTWPARGELTSGYGWRRNPLGRRWKFHSGVDIEGKRGQPIFAAAAGTVVRAHYNEGYGRMVEIDHGFGITSLYAHCTRLLVREGDEVEPGDRIGTVGSTGRSTGPHLHFEVRVDGDAVNPMDYLGRVPSLR